jgi:glycosyltransferase involved in cell wall biosynthesis
MSNSNSEACITDVLVSVIIPNLNRKKELIRAIQSVQGQTYKHFEIIVVDDCSEFSNKTYLEAKEIKFDAVQVIKNPINMGLSYSRNKGINKSKGKFIAFLDSDDFWEPEKIEKQVQLLQCNPTLDMVYCDSYLIINNKKITRNTEFYESKFWAHLSTGWSPTNPSTLMMRKRCFEKIGYFDEKLRHHEDFDFWLRASDHLNIGFCSDILSNFCFDSKDRLSYKYKSKFKETNIFLKKWEEKMIARNGLVEFNRFKAKLTSRMAVETFNSALRFKKYNNLMEVLFKYLIWDKRFYQLVWGKLKKFQFLNL